MSCGGEFGLVCQLEKPLTSFRGFSSWENSFKRRCVSLCNEIIFKGKEVGSSFCKH